MPRALDDINAAVLVSTSDDPDNAIGSYYVGWWNGAQFRPLYGADAQSLASPPIPLPPQGIQRPATVKVPLTEIPVPHGAVNAGDVRASSVPVLAREIARIEHLAVAPAGTDVVLAANGSILL